MNLFLPFELDLPDEVKCAVAKLSSDGNAQDRGAVYTKPEVVQGILDLCGYRPEKDLASLRILEPSVGEGDFLIEIVQRLIQSCEIHHGPVPQHWKFLRDSVAAIELHKDSAACARTSIEELLESKGLLPEHAALLSNHWIREGDFLLTAISGTFDFAVGNPPYVRQERIPQALLMEYKQRYRTLYDRADLYVLFYERCLNLLSEKGVLGFICANRWIKNKYGGPLREMVSQGFHLDTYIDLSDTEAFHDQVDAYPAITIIRRGPAGRTRVFANSSRTSASISAMLAAVGSASPSIGASIHHIEKVGEGRDPWLLENPEILLVIRELEKKLPTLEDAGANVRIGVASGADAVYIAKMDDLPVEDELRLPLAMSGDLEGTRIAWSGYGIINPWLESGDLTPLEEYPRLAAFFNEHAERLKGRHVARKSPKAWYKTIDRIYPSLVSTPKLLIPDIKGGATVVYDEGKFYPHHNLYYVTSKTWDLRALQTLLRSSVALTFVASYCVRMAGGFLRFQAQYLRRIRVPHWESLTECVQRKLSAISESDDQDEIDSVVFDVYRLNKHEREFVRSFAAKSRVPSKKNAD